MTRTFEHVSNDIGRWINDLLVYCKTAAALGSVVFSVLPTSRYYPLNVRFGTSSGPLSKLNGPHDDWLSIANCCCCWSLVCRLHVNISYCSGRRSHCTTTTFNFSWFLPLFSLSPTADDILTERESSSPFNWLHGWCFSCWITHNLTVFQIKKSMSVQPHWYEKWTVQKWQPFLLFRLWPK